MTELPELRAPWTSEQVDALNRFQSESGMHPFTCPKGQTLAASHGGWYCIDPDCDYTQDWAHLFMAQPNSWPRSPWAKDGRHGPSPAEVSLQLNVERPAERCGNPAPRVGGGIWLECVLQPGHQGSHADNEGARWTWRPAAGYCPHCGRGDTGPTAEQYEASQRRAIRIQTILDDTRDRARKDAASSRESERQLQQQIDRQARELDRLQAMERQVRELAGRWFVSGPGGDFIQAGKELFTALRGPNWKAKP